MRSAHEEAVASLGPPPPPLLRTAIRRKLLCWYDRHRRDLPWRRRPGDPYAQWVAEIMLQQTRVETVQSYYERFLSKFPDLAALARARHEDVLKHWEGLGYYRRALHLHEAARLLVRERRPIPREAADLAALPGIGEYTAAAISSIAFGRPEAAVDGNVARILCRLFALPEDPRQPAGRARVAFLAQSLLATRRAGDFNQAWMDLGSMVCTPRDPACPACPLRDQCAAHAEGDPQRYPAREGPRKRIKGVELVSAVFLCGDRWLVFRRPRGGLWSGLWEFPTVEADGLSPAAALRILATRCGLVGRWPRRSAGVVRHQLTHRALTFHIFVCRVREEGEASEGGPGRRWVEAEQFERLSVSTAHRRIHAEVSEQLER